MSENRLNVAGIPVRYIRILRVGRFELAITWLDRPPQSDTVAS